MIPIGVFKKLSLALVFALLRLQYIYMDARRKFLVLGCLGLVLIPNLGQGIDFRLSGESSARCFLNGTIKPINPEPGKKGFQSLDNRIRMNFDASDPPTCERFLRSYCQNNLLARGDAPLKLEAYFRPAKASPSDPEPKPTHKYQVLANCKLIVE